MNGFILISGKEISILIFVSPLIVINTSLNLSILLFIVDNDEPLLNVKWLLLLFILLLLLNNKFSLTVTFAFLT